MELLDLFHGALGFREAQFENPCSIQFGILGRH
jgi:hypothetical protein